MKQSGLFVETACKQACHGNHAPCGDKFLQQQFPAHGHTVVILSDGMGQGVKAHLLSTLTASIFMGMAGAPQSIEETARTVMQTLPVCRVRKISYSTFSIVDIDHRNDTIRLIEYDNPQAFLFRGTTPMEIERTAHPYPNLQTGRLQTFYTSRFTMQRGDRIVLTTDGVTQSGLGTDRYPFGWGRDNVARFLHDLLCRRPDITSAALARHLLDAAVENDAGTPRDDISCAAIHIREPRLAMLCSCPPSLSQEIALLAERLRTFDGYRIVCGHLLAEQIARSWNVPLRQRLTSTDPELPPQWDIEGLDLVTEGLLTLSKVLEILQHYDETPTGRGPAYHICELLLASDRIEIVVGMRRSNTAIADTETLILRRKVLGAIAQTLETQFAKQVVTTYL